MRRSRASWCRSPARNTSSDADPARLLRGLRHAAGRLRGAARRACGGPPARRGGGGAAGPGGSGAAVRSELGAAGQLRAAINFGNPILANRGPGGEPTGVSVDLAREAARRLDLPIELVPFNSAGNTVEAVKAGRVDLAFVA